MEGAARRAGPQSPGRTAIAGRVRIAPVRREAPVGMPVTGRVAHRRSGCTSLAGSRIAGPGRTGRAATPTAPKASRIAAEGRRAHRGSRLVLSTDCSVSRPVSPPMAGLTDLCCQPGCLTGRSARSTGPQKAAESRSQPARRMNRPVLSAGLHPSAALHRPGEGRVGWPPRSRTGICPASGPGTGIRPASGAAPATPSDTTVKPCSLWRHDPRYT